MMVTRAYYDNEEPAFAQYSGRGHGYPLSHERELPANHGPYGGARGHQHEARNNGQSPERESVSSHPRRRIPVACGRCRKRKIRCSGDPGNGGPCSNCKAAGNEQCQFLRVSSTEAQMKSDAADFGYDSAPAVPRTSCRMIQYGTQTYAPQPIALGPDGFPYRHSSLSYPYQGKGYYGMPSYSEFADENIDYGLQSASYQLLAQEHVNMASAYSSSGTGRGWTPAPQLPKTTPLFLEQEPAYSHGQMPYSSNGYALRPTISPESKAMSLNSMAGSLPVPPPINGTDRVLPFPAHRSSYVRSSEGMIPTPQSGRNLDCIQPYNGLMGNNIISNSKGMNTNSVSENGNISSSYISLPQSSPEAIPAAHISYGTPNLSSSQQQNEMYNPGGHDRLYNSNSNSSSEDLRSGSYGIVSPGSKRPSQSSQTDGAMSSPSPGTLANGHSYVPYHQQSYPAPPMELSGAHTHRGSGAGIQAGA